MDPIANHGEQGKFSSVTYLGSAYEADLRDVIASLHIPLSASRLTQKMVVFRFAYGKIPTDHRVGDSVTLHHPTPSGFAPTARGQWGHFYQFGPLTFSNILCQSENQPRVHRGVSLYNLSQHGSKKRFRKMPKLFNRNHLDFDFIDSKQ